jgi:hypothetical protein
MISAMSTQQASGGRSPGTSRRVVVGVFLVLLACGVAFGVATWLFLMASADHESSSTKTTGNGPVSNGDAWSLDGSTEEDSGLSTACRQALDAKLDLGSTRACDQDDPHMVYVYATQK